MKFFPDLNPNSDVTSCNLIQMSPILIFHKDWLEKIYKFTNLKDPDSTCSEPQF